MIHSPRLEEFFKSYNQDWLYSFLRTAFGITYVKTYSNCGVYVWFGNYQKEFSKNLWIDKHAPMFYSKPGRVCIEPIHAECVDECSVFVFIRYTEDQVIEKFTKSLKLKAFL